MGEKTMHKSDRTTTITPAVTAAQDQRNGSVSAIIRRAEQMIASGDYSRAQQHLAEAWTQDPGNPYIPAIAERIALLQKMSRHESSKIVRAEGSPRYLSISVGREFREGVSLAENREPVLEDELQVRIRRLTVVAIDLFERGSNGPALQSLMKAYLLDPQNPDVIACEQKLLPAREALRKHDAGLDLGDTFSSEDMPGGAAAAALRLAAESDSAVKASGEPPASGMLPPALQERLDALKRLKEAERIEHERALWRNASGPPRSPGQRTIPD
jgi:tetratricopeptide (TPR) repeat protein